MFDVQYTAHVLSGGPWRIDLSQFRRNANPISFLYNGLMNTSVTEVYEVKTALTLDANYCKWRAYRALRTRLQSCTRGVRIVFMHTDNKIES